MWQILKRTDMHRGFWWENLTERDHLEELYVVGRIILKWIIKRQDGRVWKGFVRLGIWISGGFWWTRWRSSGIHRWDIWPAKKLSVSRRLCPPPMQLISSSKESQAGRTVGLCTWHLSGSRKRPHSTGTSGSKAEKMVIQRVEGWHSCLSASYVHKLLLTPSTHETLTTSFFNILLTVHLNIFIS